MKKVKIFSTVGQTSTTVEIEGNTWGEVKAKLPSSINVDSMKFIEGQNRTQLIADQSVLPEGDEVVVYAVPVKTKSGTDLLDYEPTDEDFEDNPENEVVISEGSDSTAIEDTVDGMTYVEMLDAAEALTAANPNSSLRDYENMNPIDLRLALKRNLKDAIQSEDGSLLEKATVQRVMREVAQAQLTLVKAEKVLEKVIGESSIVLLEASSAIDGVLKDLRNSGIMTEIEEDQKLADNWNDIAASINL